MKLNLNSPATARRLLFLMPLCLGLLALLMGQDTNEDLFNYHFYNPYAWLTGRLTLDLAPAQMQSYFNPLLDVPFYLMASHWPPAWVGFTLALVQGLAFVLVYAIARQVMPTRPASEAYRAPLLVAILGCLGAGFLVELGGVMGDDIVTLFVLGSMLLILTTWPYLRDNPTRAGGIILVAGVVSGLGTALKLTTAPYAVGLCLGFLATRLPWRCRFKWAFIFGLGVLAGMAVAGGFWYVTLWKTFGNPLFPMYNNVFHASLANAASATDPRFLPRSWFEYLAWPFIFALNPKRVTETHLREVSFAILYILYFILASRFILKNVRHADETARPFLSDKERYFLTAIAVGYLLWMVIFSIYRYLIPLEVLAPLAIWILLFHLIKSEIRFKRAVKFTFIAIVILTVPSGWGRSWWADHYFRVSLPPLPDPSHSTVLLTAGPLGYVVPFFPPSVAFAYVQPNFPASARYKAAAKAIVERQGGPVYALFPGKYNFRESDIRKVNAVLNTLGLTVTASRCDSIAKLIRVTHLHASVHFLPTGQPGPVCQLGIAPGDYRNTFAENQAVIQTAKGQLADYGFHLMENSCQILPSYAASQPNPLLWCAVKNQ